MFGFGAKFRLLRVAGIPIQIDLSWFLIAVLVTWSLAAGLFRDPTYFPTLADQPGVRWAMGLAGALGLFASIVLHELGHALAARRRDLPVRGITLFVFGGVAEMTRDPQTPGDEFVMAIAGPLVSVGLAVLFFLLGLLPLALPVAGVLAWLATINVMLVVFNLVPAFPLDGGRVLRSALWAWTGRLRWATRVVSNLGIGFGVLLILFGVLSFISGNFVGGMWLFLIGLFVQSVARASYQQLLMRRALEGEPVARFTQTQPHAVPPDLTVGQLVEDYVYRYHHKLFPVLENGRLVGCVTTQQIRQVPRERWQEARVAEVASPCSECNTIRADADAMEALSRMNQNGRSRLIVVDDQNRLVGVITLRDLMRFLSLKVELEQAA